MNETLRSVSVQKIHLSQTVGQIERRKHFDKTAIAELADSIKDVGLLSPLVVRPLQVIHRETLNGQWVPLLQKTVFSPDEADDLRNNNFELVAGERRYIAAQKAGLDKLPVSVRDLTDDQVLEVQLIENLQREGLHELAEAEGYEQLHQRGHSAEDIAGRVGKSKAYVYARMKLLALCKEARKAFYEDKISASIALLLARIPADALQKQALKEILDGDYDGPFSYRQAQIHIQEEYMLRLDGAGFKTEDTALVPAAGACSACPKRTGNQPELFGDIKRADVCTDPTCFKAKREAHAARAIAAAEASGQVVLEGKEAKKIFPYSGDHPSGAYSTLDDKPWEDPKRRTARQLLGKDFVPVLVKHPESGKLIELAPESAIKAALKDAGVKTSSSSNSYRNEQSAADKKRKFESKFRRSLYDQVRAKLPQKFGDDDYRNLAYRFFDEIWNDAQKLLLDIWGWDKGPRGDMMTTVGAQLKKLDEDQVIKFLWDCIFVRELLVASYSTAPATMIFAAARKLKLDPEKIRAQLKAEAAAKKKPAKASPKKAKVKK